MWNVIMKDENPYVDRVCTKIQLRIYKSDCIYTSTKSIHQGRAAATIY